MLRIIVHLIAALQFTFGCYYDWKYVQVPIEVRPNGSTYGGKLIFLTFWDALVQTVFFWICLLNDLIGSNEICIPKQQPLIRKFKDLVFCSIAFPLSAFVSATFWGLYLVDRELVLPKVMDDYFPVWLNHIMHTNIIIFSLIELVSSFRMYPSHKKGLGILTAFMITYLIWMFIIYCKTGHWVYPVMDVLNWPQKVLFVTLLLIAAQGFYLIGEIFNKIIWCNEIKAVCEETMRKVDKRKKYH